ELFVDASGNILSKLIFDKMPISDVMSIYYHSKQNKYYIGSITSGLYIVAPSEFYYPDIPEIVVREGLYTQEITPDEQFICQRALIDRRNNIGRTLKNIHTNETGSTLYLKEGRYLY